MKAILPNRKEAGKRLAQKLTAYANEPNVIVLGLPRGGVIVAYEIARALNLPLDICLVKKLGTPGNPEIAMGAIAEDGLMHDYSKDIVIIDKNTTQNQKIDREEIRAVFAKKKAELRWRERCYQNYRPMLEIRDRIVIIVDDGIATGLTMHAAIRLIRQHQPKSIIIAVPVLSFSVIEQLKTQADDIVYIIAPKSFHAVGLWYGDFTQTTDREVCNLLSQATHKSTASYY
ncbi:MAG: phosphoribosyltransferase [Xenococcaceae cyanobacterium MO_234.B1]|nr:phosphoribosyltransferase [Xenococcaceae cyanobacterium MO_234.B1]